jgi:hypothetical protein
MTPYDRTTRENDEEHERKPASAIMQAIGQTSRVSDCDAIVLRTGEATRSLLMVPAAPILSMPPSAMRSPAAIRKTIEKGGKRLRHRVAAAEASERMQAFLRRTFHGDVGGHA